MKKIIIAGIFLFLLFIAGIIGINVFNNIMTNTFDNVAPKEYAIKKAQNNKELKIILGDNIIIKEQSNKLRKKGNFTFSLSGNGLGVNQNSIDLKIIIEGDKGKGTLTVLAHKKNKQWIYEQLHVQITDSGKQIELLKPENQQTI